jgi:two-component system, NtrC family, sensor kinase
VAIAPERLEQVLLNLMMNAADAVRRPGGRIAVDATRDDDHVRITVEDDGGGIAASVRERLFEPFVTTKDVGRGTGLGLAVCRGLVEAAGGTIHAEDGAEGARFVLALPVVGEGAEVGEGQGAGGV